MEILNLPPEVIERIFVHLDTQALTACALADSHLANIIYSSHFLDLYCRKSLCCNWITVADVCKATIAVPYEFWFWVYNTIKVNPIFPNLMLYWNQILFVYGNS